MSSQKRLIYMVLGPVIFAVLTLLLKGSIGVTPAEGIAAAAWMIFWWITRPVDIQVTALLPGVVNALFNIVPMGDVIGKYSSGSIILIFGSLLITIPWAFTGLDRRIALKALSIIGPDMKRQVAVWLIVPIIFSTVLPNVVVVAIFTPIAIAMLKAAGYDGKHDAAVPILCAIGWGAGIGGVGSPFGGAMNVSAIQILQEFTGREFMYADWVKYTIPYLVIATIIMAIVMVNMPMEVKRIDGAKEYFDQLYKELGPMKSSEVVGLVIFLLALGLSFARPLYSSTFPTLEPYCIFLILGFLNFFITIKDFGLSLTWESAQKNMMWGMMILFAGGLALGAILTGSGANAAIAEAISSMNFDGGLTTVILIGVFACAISEFSNSTVSAALTVPLVLGLTQQLGLDPGPYFFVAVICYNSEFLLPVSVRAIPIGYGLDPSKMMKKGIVPFIVRTVTCIVVSYLFLTFWPGFGTLS
ncbi:MAG: anion permease [Lachnospiraceae bacterium]|nr:anion permease [Lachnospiraceae bacterium]